MNDILQRMVVGICVVVILSCVWGFLCPEGFPLAGSILVGLGFGLIGIITGYILIPVDSSNY